MDTECLIDIHVPNVEHDHIMRQAIVRVREYRPRGASSENIVTRAIHLSNTVENMTAVLRRI